MPKKKSDNFPKPVWVYVVEKYTSTDEGIHTDTEIYLSKRLADSVSEKYNKAQKSKGGACPGCRIYPRKVLKVNNKFYNYMEDFSRLGVVKPSQLEKTTEKTVAMEVEDFRVTVISPKPLKIKDKK